MLLKLLFLFGVLMSLAACADEERSQKGALLFAQNCATCHGADAKGGGGANVWGLGRTPPDLTVLTRQSGGVFPHNAVIAALAGYAAGTNRARRMRPFDDLTTERLVTIRKGDEKLKAPKPQAAVLAYLETLQE